MQDSSAPRLRRRPLVPLNPQIQRPASGTPISTAKLVEKTSASIARIRTAFQDTPLRLRELEEGWREKRKRVLGHGAETPIRDGIPAPGQARKAEVGGGVGGDRMRRKRREDIRAPVRAAVRPITPPPTPPPSPSRAKLPQNIQTYSMKVSHPRIIPHIPDENPPNVTPKPILSHPLIPTSKPIRLSSNPRSTIHTHPPTSPYELSIELATIKVHVYRGGRVIQIGERKLLLNGLGRDEKEWMIVQDLVEGFKRRTPRVKVYHPLGQLIITCSNPPDIVLSFGTDTDNAVSSSPLSPAGQSKRVEKARQRTKIRATYSRSTRSVILEISSSSPCSNPDSQDRNEKGETGPFRSKRTIPLSEPPWSITSKTTSREDDHHYYERICKGLGLRPGRWSNVEVEAVRRLWVLREDWGRY